MKYTETAPKAPLNLLVKCFWMLEKTYDEITPFETLYADGCLDLVWSQSDTKTSCFFIGQQTRRLDLAQSGKVRSLGIRFFPFGARPFTKLPLRGLTDKVVEAADVFGKKMISVDATERLFSLPFEQSVSLLENWMLKNLRSSEDIPGIQAASHWLYASHGNRSIDALANDVNMSTRTLHRKFEDFIGVSPKSLARIFRFNKVRNELTLQPDKSLTSLAYEYNYFDQSHFIRDFKAFTSITPADFTQSVRNRKIYFNKANIV